MSHNHDESSYEEDDYEKNARYGYVHREPRVPTKISNPPRTPVIGRQSSVIINTYDLMKQLYLMGDALNSFHSRLTIMEHRRKWRGHVIPVLGMLLKKLRWLKEALKVAIAKSIIAFLGLLRGG